jgi:hypothetical protein
MPLTQRNVFSFVGGKGIHIATLYALGYTAVFSALAWVYSRIQEIRQNKQNRNEQIEEHT